MRREQKQGDQQRQTTGDQGHQHRHPAKIRQDEIFALLKGTVGTKTGERQLHNPCQHQTACDQISHRHLKLGDRQIWHHHAKAENTDNQDADNRQHPRTRADHTGIGIGPDQPKQGVLAQQFAKFKPDTGH